MKDTSPFSINRTGQRKNNQHISHVFIWTGKEDLFVGTMLIPTTYKENSAHFKLPKEDIDKFPLILPTAKAKKDFSKIITTLRKTFPQMNLNHAKLIME